MKRLIVAAIAVLFIAGTSGAYAAGPLVGRWAIATRGEDPGRVQLRLEYSESNDGNNSNASWSSAVTVADAGISLERLRGPLGPVSFTVVREPGTFACAGSAGEGSGAGQFTYQPSATFDAALAARGMGRPTPHESLELAIAGTTLAFVDHVRGSSSHATVADLVRLMQHGVNARYVADLAALGYKTASVDQLVRMRDHGVGTDFVRAVQSAGYRDLSADDLVRLADHGVMPKYIGDLAAAGYKNLSPQDLVALRDHGVSAGFVDRLKAHGYANLSVRDLIRLRDSGL